MAERDKLQNTDIFPGMVVMSILIILGMLVAGTIIIALSMFAMHIPDTSDSSVPADYTLPFEDEQGNAIHLTNNKSATDPTFAQLVAFLHDDTTDQISVSRGEAIARLHDNAEAHGIRAGIAEMKSPPVDPSTNIQGVYACNMFRTSDRGIIYVDELGPDKAPGTDYILFFHPKKYYGTSYAAYYVPIENISKIDVDWKTYPDYHFTLSPQQLNETGSFPGELTIYPSGVILTTW